MRTFRKTTTRPNFLFGLLPLYFKENDTYKDINGDGLLERYLEIFCREIDYEVTPYTDGLPLLYDAELLYTLPGTNPTKFLDHLSDMFGNPPDIGTEAQYIALINHIFWIFKTRGTVKSLTYFLALYGYMVDTMSSEAITLNSYDEVPTPAMYDNSGLYDLGFVFYSDWSLVITDIPGTGTKNPSAAWLLLLKEAIQKFISPIFATLTTLSYTV